MKYSLMKISQTMNYTLMAIILLEETEILSETAWQHILMSIYSFLHTSYEHVSILTLGEL